MSKDFNQIFDLIEPSDDPNYVKVKQATKTGWILCEVGGQPTYHTRIVSCAEAEYRVAVK